MRVQFLNLPQFRDWLVRDGATLQATHPSNPYEILRYISGGSNTIGLAFRNDKNSSVALQGAAPADYRRFGSGEAAGKPPANRLGQVHRGKIARKLNARDGHRCFFCHAVEAPGEPLTIEHLLARTHGGTHNIANLCWACEPCNQFLGNAPLVKKLEYYHSLHGRRTAALRQKGYEDA